MNRQSPSIEWQVVEDDTAWSHLCAPPLSEHAADAPAGHGRYAIPQRLIRIVVLLLLLASISAGGGYIMRARSQQQSVDGDATVQPELTWVGRTGNRPARGEENSLNNLERWSQHSEEERRLETPYFVYRFRQIDAAAVIAVAPQVDALYVTLRQNLGLPIAPGTEKLVIQVSPTAPSVQNTPWLHVADSFTIPAPEVYPAEVELTDAQLLAQAIALQLSGHVLAQAGKQHQIDPAWQPLMSGLYLWQVWDLDLPLSTWRDVVVQWLYVTLPVTPRGARVLLPDYYTELCAMHRLWVPTPAQLGIPFICTEADQQEWFFSSLNPRNPLMRLDQLAMEMHPEEYDLVAHVHHPSRTVALAILIDYTVVTYGRERLPALVAGLRQSKTWDTLIPAVFGVSPAEFESGWQAFLVDRYGVR